MAGTLLLGCSADPAPDRSGESAAPVPVAVETVVASDVARVLEIGGLVQARTSALLTSRLMAPVLEVHVAPGDHVRRGQVLVTLDGRDLQAQARRASSAATAVRAGRTALDADRQAAAAALELARQSHGRIATLVARRSATPQELDEATASLHAAEARVAAIDARALEADAAASGAAAGHDAAVVSAGFATVTAPFGGVVTEKLIEPGNMAMPGTPLLRLDEDGGYTLDVRLDAAVLPDLGPGTAVDVEIDAARPLTLAGRVREVSRAMQTDGRAFEVRIDLPADPALRAGLFGRARIPTEVAAGGTGTVATSAVQRRGQVASVFVVDGQVARRRMIVVGAALPGNRLEVLSGLEIGEQVIADPPASLRDGDAVRTGGQ